jgi:hypothetical protein
MNDDAKKHKHIEEVKILLEEFCKKYFSSELSEYTLALWGQLGRKRNYSITGGRKQIWASAIIFVIARLNFLFDRSNEYHLTPDTICEFFGTKKSTVSSKTTEIEKICRIRMNQEGLCSPEISDSLTLFQLPNGIVLNKRQAKEMGLL